MSQSPLLSNFPNSFEDAWPLLDRFIKRWRKPADRPLGLDADEIEMREHRLGMAVPPAIRSWYRRFGKGTPRYENHRDVKTWSGQDWWLCLEDTFYEDGLLIFRRENQSCCLWGVRHEDLAVPDPPVWCLEGAKQRQDSSTFSRFAAISLVLESMWRAPICATAYQMPGEPDVLLTLRSRLAVCDLPSRYWVLDPVRISEGDDIYLVESLVDAFIYLCAKTEAAFKKMCEEIDCDIERIC